LNTVKIAPADIKSETGRSPLFFVAPTARTNSSQVFEALRHAGVKPNEADALGQTPFHALAKKLASSSRAVPFFSALLAIGGAPAIKDPEGRDALAAARERQLKEGSLSQSVAASKAQQDRRALKNENLFFLERCVLHREVGNAKKGAESPGLKNMGTSATARPAKRI